MDECWFYLVSVDLERNGGSRIANELNALEAVMIVDDERLTRYFIVTILSINHIKALNSPQ